MPLRHLALALSLLLSTAHVSAQANPPLIATDGTLLSVSANASSHRVPDVARISTGVVTRAADARQAMSQNAEAMAKVMATLRAAGIEERDIQTSGVNLNAQYDYNNRQNNTPPRITGYEARNTVSVKVRKLDGLGKVMDTLVAAGANDLNGPSFEVDKPEAAYDEARVAALAKAQARAELYARTLGLRVRRVVSIDEGGGMSVRPVPYAGAMRAMAAAAPKADTEIAPGESELSVNLDVTFELGK